MTAPMTAPTWERRLRAAQIAPWGLMGATVAWADDESDVGVLVANPSGRFEVFSFDAGQTPPRLTQISDRPQGTMGASISPDGSRVFWFDDSAGDEVGRWNCADAAGGGDSVSLLSHLDPGYPAGIVALPDGRTVVGRLLDSARYDGVAFELALAKADGAGDVVHRGRETAFLVDVSHDAARALLAVAREGNFLRLRAVVVDLDSGAVVAEIADEDRMLTPSGFHPADRDLVLFMHERGDVTTSALWNVATGAQDDVTTSMVGDTTATWYPDGDALLLTVLHDARHQLYRYDRETGTTTRIELPPGTVTCSSARPDGSVHALSSASDRPVALLRSNGGEVSHVVTLAGPEPEPAPAAHDVHVDGPGGRIHALVYEPDGRSRPHPALFVPHGGPTGQDFDAWNARGAAYLDLGYAVVRVNYRGSTGYGAAWRDALHERLGFIELEDIGAVREHLEAQGVIDPDRVGIVGGSWGGFLTLMALGTQPDRWRAGAALVPLADQFTSAEDAPQFMRDYDAGLFGGTIEEVPELYRAASPITYVDNVVAPVLITAGENDPRCPVRQVDTYVEALKARGHDVEYRREDTGHMLPDLDMMVDETRHVLDFFTRTLPIDG
jgi:dipeptidyl aminopeptidase/acylaminoacyl peptidase